MRFDAFWELLEPIHPRVEAFCRKLEGDRDNGDDLYQETLLIALRKFNSLRDRKAFRPWLYRIVINRYKNRNRKGWLIGHEFGKPHETISDATHDPRTIYESRIWLDKAFSALSAEEKTLVVLYEIDGWSVEELTLVYKKRAGTIKSRLSRARRKMRRAIEKYLSDHKSLLSVSESIYALQRSNPAD